MARASEWKGPALISRFKYAIHCSTQVFACGCLFSAIEGPSDP